MVTNLPFSSSPSPWPCHPCSQPKTHSFRAAASSAADDVEEDEPAGDESEAVLRGLRSSRLFFDPCSGGTRSIAPERQEEAAFDGGAAVEMESTDPFGDFKASMEEMVEARGAADWVWLREMLVWLLKANCKGAHGFIVGAFLDLLIGLAAASSSSFSSPPNFEDPLCSSCSSNSSFILEIQQTNTDNG